MGEAKPVRLQLSRRKGFNLQALSQATNGLPAVNVARPGKWGNPFGGDNTEVVKRFREWLTDNALFGMVERAPFLCCRDRPECKRDHKCYRRTEVLESLSELRGKNLACWCAPDQECHADVLLELANPTPTGEQG